MEKFIHLEPELEARIYYLSYEEGGRKKAVPSGYRGQFYYDGYDWDAMQIFVGVRDCQPGEWVLSYLITSSPQLHKGRLRVGKKFEIREGKHIVAKGEITKVLRKDFEQGQALVFHPEFNYSQLDLSIRENLILWQFGKMVKNLNTLASPANRQKEIIAVKNVADKMIKDFEAHCDEYHSCFVKLKLLDKDSAESLKKLSKFIAEQKTDKNLLFWEDEMLASLDSWRAVREMAHNALLILDLRYNQLE